MGIRNNSRRKYDSEFKRETFRLVLEEGRKASEIEHNPGIIWGWVFRWVRVIKFEQMKIIA